MRFDLAKFPTDENDVQIKDENQKLATFREILMKCAANDVDENGVPLRGEVKYTHYDLYTKIRKAKRFVDLEASEIVLLNKASLGFPVFLTGQVRDFLKSPEAEAIEK